MASGRAANRSRWVEVVEAWRRSALTQVDVADARGLRLGGLRVLRLAPRDALIASSEPTRAGTPRRARLNALRRRTGSSGG